jgi:hypothetical protein
LNERRLVNDHTGVVVRRGIVHHQAIRNHHQIAGPAAQEPQPVPAPVASLATGLRQPDYASTSLPSRHAIADLRRVRNVSHCQRFETHQTLKSSSAGFQAIRTLIEVLVQ